MMLHGNVAGSPMSARRGVARCVVRTVFGKTRRGERWYRSAQGLDGSGRGKIGLNEEGAGTGRDQSQTQTKCSSGARPQAQREATRRGVERREHPWIYPGVTDKVQWPGGSVGSRVG